MLFSQMSSGSLCFIQTLPTHLLRAPVPDHLFYNSSHLGALDALNFLSFILFFTSLNTSCICTIYNLVIYCIFSHGESQHREIWYVNFIAQIQACRKMLKHSNRSSINILLNRFDQWFYDGNFFWNIKHKYISRRWNYHNSNITSFY